MIYIDKDLSKRLERTEMLENADVVETRSRVDPGSGACWAEIGGAYAMFDDVESPITQTFGLGMFQDVDAGVLEQIEQFFQERGARVAHEVSPMADQSILKLFADRKYRPVELTAVMFQELDPAAPPRTPINPDIQTRIISEDEADIWAGVAAAAWGAEDESLRGFMLDFGKVVARTAGGLPFIAELDGAAIASGGFAIYDDVCILSGAATIPEARRRGAQSALLTARLNYAAANGCRLAMMCAHPGSQSQKNAQKNGFLIAYTRIKWQLFT